MFPSPEQEFTCRLPWSSTAQSKHQIRPSTRSKDEAPNTVKIPALSWHFLLSSFEFLHPIDGKNVHEMKRLTSRETELRSGSVLDIQELYARNVSFEMGITQKCLYSKVWNRWFNHLIMLQLEPHVLVSIDHHTININVDNPPQMLQSIFLRFEFIQKIYSQFCRHAIIYRT